MGQKVALEVRVVGDERSSHQQCEHVLRHGFDARRLLDISVGEAGETDDGARDRFPRPHERLGEHDLGIAGRQLDDSHFEDLRAPVVRESCRLEVDDRQRARPLEERRHRAEIDADLSGRDAPRLQTGRRQT